MNKAIILGAQGGEDRSRGEDTRVGHEAVAQVHAACA